MHPQFLFTHSSYKWTTKTCSAPLVFTKFHPSYHLNSTQPDYAMWQSPPCKLGQPYADTCHNPPLTKITNQILPHHHLTHETLSLIFIISFHHHGSRHRQSRRQTSGHHSSTIFLPADHHSRSNTSIALHHLGNRALFAHPTSTRSATLGHHFT